MVTMVEGVGDIEASNIYKHVAVEPVEIVWLKTTTANIKPGMGVVRDTGANGQDECTEHTAATPAVHDLYGIAELDLTQINNCDDTYAAGDVIPVIPLRKNLGKLLRNILLDDPGGNVNVDAEFSASESNDGYFQISTEATLIDEDGNGITSAFNDAGGPTVAGTDGANGAKIFNREYLRSGEYIADPNASSRVLAYIINC